MKKNIFSVLSPILFSLIGLELFFRVLGVVPMASKFVENLVMINQLVSAKESGEIRIFTYGESTMQGANYAPLSSPAKWLEIYLKDFLPAKKIRVVNFARMGQGSLFTLETFRQTLAYRPDIVIFYLGHNDFLPGNRKDKAETKFGSRGEAIKRLIYESRFFSFFYRIVLRRSIERHNKKFEDSMGYDLKEVVPGTLKMGAATPRNEPFYSQNVNFFKNNVSEIIEVAHQHNLPVLFLKPVANLKDFSPLESLHQKPLTQENLKLWETHFQAGVKAQQQKQYELALIQFQKAYEIDSTYAELPFRMGQIYFQNAQFKEAKRYFLEAKDQDAIVCRATKEMLGVLEDLKSSHSLQLIDTEKVLEPEALGRILGEPIIEDNVHFSIKGHSLVGKLMAEELASRGWVAPASEWDFTKERSYELIYKNMGIQNDLISRSYIKVANYLGDRYEDRIRILNRANDMNPNHPDILRALAWSYWLGGKKELAIKTYRELELVNPQILTEIFAHHLDLKKAYDSSGKIV